mmetsp:Transcript_22012/g.45490  ORF Transcript_22012/g.45490 Transcript_22012/m.45490 type:complete len:387 (-) Transcript_22012:750-1910(-)
MDSITASEKAALLEICQDLRKGVDISSSILLEHSDELVKYANTEDLSSLLRDIKYLHERKAYLSKKRVELKTFHSKKEYTLAEAELQHIDTRLSSNEKRLCAKLLKHPSIANNIRKAESTCEEYGTLFAEAVRELREHGTYTILQEKSVSLVSFKERRDDTAAKAKQTRESVSQLRDTLMSEKPRHEERVRGLEIEISQVKRDISQLQDGTRLHRAAMEEKAANTYASFNEKENSLKSDKDKLQRLIRKAERDHQEKAHHIQQETSKLQDQIEIQKQRITQESDANSAELAALKDRREINLSALEDLQRRWDSDEAEAKRIEEQREEERLARAEQEEETGRQRLAVAIISVAYRIYVKRKAKLVAAGSKQNKKNSKAKKRKKGNKE